MLFSLANLPYWILMLIGVALFLAIILLGGGDDDIDTDVDADVDVDTDVDSDADFNAGLLSILGFLGIGKVPLILLLAMNFSLWGMIGWMLNIWVSQLIGEIPINILGIGGIIFGASLVVSLVISNWLAYPIGKIFAPFSEDVSSTRLVGHIGTVTSKKVPHHTEGKVGQVDVFDSTHNLVTIEVSLPSWAKVIPHRQDKVLIIEYRETVYLVIAKDSSDEDKWMQQ